MSFTLKSVALVGCGNMGGALLRGWLREKFIENIYIITPRQESISPYLERNNVRWIPHPSQLDEKPECIILAVKPQVLGQILDNYQRFVSDETLFISVAASKTKKFFKTHLGDHVKILRCMPNTPAVVGLGVTLAVADPLLSAQHRLYIKQLMSAVGLVQWFDDEAMIDVGGAVTGCGPAYVFQFIESLSEAALSCGLKLELENIQNLVQTMVMGSITYLTHSGKPAAVLRREVTSPHGMTEAALNIIAGAEGLTELLTKGIAAAVQRAQEMSNDND